jgi:hypothetical protein
MRREGWITAEKREERRKEKGLVRDSQASPLYDGLGLQDAPLAGADQRGARTSAGFLKT